VATAGSAQTKQITSNEYFTSNSKAHSLMSERSWRMEMKTDTLNGASIVKSITKTHERLLPDRERFVATEKIGDKETRSELIRVGFMEYRRENNEPWISKDLRGSGGGIGNSGGFACIQHTEEADAVGGIPARKLRQYSIEKTSEGLSFDDMAVWLDSNGFFLKSERIKGLLEPRTEKSRSVVTYEYEPNIKIEAPIKESESKAPVKS
jgi:hypothetical protein